MPSQNGELVPQHDDLQFLKVVRAPTQDGELEGASKKEVAEREQHGASGGVRCERLFYASVLPPYLRMSCRPGQTR